MNFIVKSVRAIVFRLHSLVYVLHPKVVVLLILDLPGLLFFSTYALLVLFWAEIYHQARSLPTDKLRLAYMVFLLLSDYLILLELLTWLTAPAASFLGANMMGST